MNKHGRLRFAHDQLRAVFDLLIANRKAIKHRVARIVEPLNNFDELRGRAESVKNSHGVLLKVIARHYTAKECGVFNLPRKIRAGWQLSRLVLADARASAANYDQRP